MANSILYCKRCGGYTETNISYDIDSEPGEPCFIHICLRCEGKSECLEKEPDKKQSKLNFKEGGKK